MIIKCTVTIFFALISQSIAKNCSKDDLTFVYTECDKGERWRVQVPKIKCTPQAMAIPTKGLSCNATCPEGHYLNASTDSCTKCPPGTYSPGNTVEWNRWNAKPPEFLVASVAVDEDSSRSCSESIWTASGTSMDAWVDTGCQAVLSYSVDMATVGEVKFTYKASDSVIAIFGVQNSLCQDSDSDVFGNSRKILTDSDAGDAAEFTMPLPAGRVLLRWGVSNPSSQDSSTSSSSSPSPSMSLLTVRVSGVRSSTSCRPCQAGEFSQEGQAACKLCPADTYSAASAGNCAQCQSHEFAPAGSSQCTRRPECTKFDYELGYGDCVNGKRVGLYRWVKPTICDPQLNGSKRLPLHGGMQDCRHTCQPGTQLVGGTDCQFCAVGSHSPNGTGECTACPSGTQPQLEYLATSWYMVPPLIQLTCGFSRECNTAGGGNSSGCVNGWQLMGDRLVTAAWRSASTRILELLLPGFADNGDGDSGEFVSELIVDFKTDCAGECRLYFYSSRDSLSTKIKDWTGSQKRHLFKYRIRTREKMTLTILFVNNEKLYEQSEKPLSKLPANETGLANRLTVFSIRATNVIKVGAIACKSCPMGVRDHRCIPCPPSQIYTSNSTALCTQCPSGTVPKRVSGNSGSGSSQICAKCPTGLRTTQQQTECEFDTEPTLSDGRRINYGQLLSGSLTVEGGSLFSTGGTRYRHVYNVSAAVAQCSSNSSKPKTVKSHICRITMVFMHNNGSRRLAILPMGFGDTLVKAATTEEYPEAKSLMKQSGFEQDPFNLDRHVQFVAESVTSACPNGRQSVLTLRCDPRASRAQLKLPTNCPDGTCDGCRFHFLLTARTACPRCSRSDYDVVDGECQMGKQIRHYFMPSYCYESGTKTAQKLTETLSCPIIDGPVGLALIVATAVGVLSLAVACYCYRQNRSLQYKYSQLIESRDDEDFDDLAGAESCAVHEDEDEEEEEGRRGRGGGGGGGGVGRNGRSVLSRLRHSIVGRSAAAGNRSRGQIEHLNLTEDMEELSI